MISPSQEVENKTPAQICALYDVGGGVALGNSFAIYSIVAPSPIWNQAVLESTIYQDLQVSASAVADLLPIFTSLHDAAFDLVSLHCPLRQQSESNAVIHDPPWFLLNAAKCSQHCIFGQGSILDSLLRVLQRPWCILELCCCDTPILEAINSFTTLASEICHTDYSPAAKLISHELKTRRELDDRSAGLCDTQPPFWRNPSKPISDAASLYTDLRQVFSQSRKSFWMGMISTCAVYMNVTFSDLVLIIGGLYPYNTSISRLESMEKSLRLQGRLRLIEAMLELSGGVEQIPTSNSDPILESSNKSGIEQEIRGVDQTALKNASDDMKKLLALYERILTRVGESALYNIPSSQATD